MYDRRAAVSPVDVERPVLRDQIALPRQFSVEVERHNLARAEPRIHALAIRHRTRGSQVVLLVNGSQLSLSWQFVFPERPATGSVKRSDQKGHISADRGAATGGRTQFGLSGGGGIAGLI